MKDKDINLFEKIKKTILNNLVLFYFLTAVVIVMIFLSFFIKIGYVLTVIAVISFLMFSSRPNKGEDVLLYDQNARRREIFLELKDLKKILNEEPENQEALRKYYELKKELDKK